MTFEIDKCEGWGRIGLTLRKRGFITPNIITPCFYNHDSHLKQYLKPSSYECQKNAIPLWFKGNQSNIELEEKREIEFFPSCFVYPSLQMQGKTLKDVTSLDDLFPVNIREIFNSRVAYHLIPWDLPTVYLNKFDEYLEILNKFEDTEFNSDTQLVLNFPFTYEILNTKLPSLKSSAISVICLGDISSMLTHPKLLISFLKQIKSWISPNIMLYAPGIPSSYIPILVYLGLDLFDFLYIDMYLMKLHRQSDLILEQKATKDNFLYILNLTREALKINKLRDLTRIFANSYPPLKSLLRTIDKEIPIEEGTPIHGPNTLYCTDETDFTRPEVTRFRERVRTRYSIPSYITGIIFLPCSAKKPYSKSKSHSIFQNIIRRNLKGKRHSIEEIILTSPLGVVPRNLEYSFPAAHYDIPVTGDWSELEKNNLIVDLNSILTKIDKSIPLLGYVIGTEQEVLINSCEQQNRSLFLIEKDITSLTSKEALHEFSILLKAAFNDIPRKLRIPSQLAFLRTVADFQFGQGVGSILIPDRVRIFGRKELGFQVKLDNKHHITFRAETGYLTLSLAAGELIKNHVDNVIIFDGQKIEGSTIFTKAISKANSKIRPNDEVLVIDREENLIAVGVALLPGDLLVKSNRGKGVILRQKVK